MGGQSDPDLSLAGGLLGTYDETTARSRLLSTNSDYLLSRSTAESTMKIRLADPTRRIAAVTYPLAHPPPFQRLRQPGASPFHLV